MTHLHLVEDAKFDHVAHVAPRIRELLPLYAEMLGGRFSTARSTASSATGCSTSASPTAARSS